MYKSWCLLFHISLILFYMASMHQIPTRCRMSRDNRPRKLPRRRRPRQPVDCKPLFDRECFMLVLSFLGRTWPWLKSHRLVSCLAFVFQMFDAIAWVNHSYLLPLDIFTWHQKSILGEEITDRLPSPPFTPYPPDDTCTLNYGRSKSDNSEAAPTKLDHDHAHETESTPCSPTSGSKDVRTQCKRPVQSVWTNQKDVAGRFQTKSLQAVCGVQQWPREFHQEVFDKEGPWEGIWAWGVFRISNRRRFANETREALLQMVHRGF